MSLEELANDYLQSHRGSVPTRIGVWLALTQFIAHLPWQVEQIHQLTERHLISYRAWLAGQNLEPDTKYSRFLELRVFLRWAFDRGVLLLPLGQDLEEKHPGRRWFSRYSQKQIAQLLLQPPDTPIGRTDRFVLELFYGTGLRRQEMGKLLLTDLTETGVWVRLGKGGKDRLVPIGPSLRDQINYYLQEVRPLFEPKPDQKFLLLNAHGERLTMQIFAHRFREYVRQAGLPPRGLHSLRHAYATHLLENGARLEDIMRLLGHSSIRATQIYTNITAKELRRAVRKTHPRRRKGKAE